MHLRLATIAPELEPAPQIEMGAHIVDLIESIKVDYPFLCEDQLLNQATIAMMDECMELEPDYELLEEMFYTVRLRLAELETSAGFQKVHDITSGKNFKVPTYFPKTWGQFTETCRLEGYKRKVKEAHAIAADCAILGGVRIGIAAVAASHQTVVFGLVRKTLEQSAQNISELQALASTDDHLLALHLSLTNETIDSIPFNPSMAALIKRTRARVAKSLDTDVTIAEIRPIMRSRQMPPPRLIREPSVTA